MLTGLEIYLGFLAFTWVALFAVCLLVFKFSASDSALFAAIQTMAGPPWAPLVAAGIPICLVLSLRHCTWQDEKGLYHWIPRLAWLWDNEEDGVHPGWYASQFANWSSWRITFVWSAVRNPVNNFRFVPGVSKVGRPLWYRTWTILGKKVYAKAGWMSNGFPACSAGAGQGF